MPNAKVEDLLALDPVAEDIGTQDRHLAPSFACIAPAFRIFRKAVGDRDQTLRKARGGARIEG